MNIFSVFCGVWDGMLRVGGGREVLMKKASRRRRRVSVSSKGLGRR